ncbi:MAG: amino acid permease, partial [Planctomycetota bacterium]|nr:amino acid permease [Planctomycetota bacterium]
VIVAALIHGIKIKVGVSAQNVAVILKLALLLAFLIYASFKLRPAQVINDLDPVEASKFPVLFSKQLMWIAFSYMGFNAAVYIADEVQEAKTKIPNALLWGTSITFFLYVALNFVFVYSADASVIKQSMGKVAAVSAENLGGVGFKNLFVVIISIALFTSVTSMMMAAPRVYAKMADERMLPSIFSFQKETPQYAIILQVILASIIIYFSTLKTLLDYLGTTLSLCAAASVSSLFLKKLRGGRSLLSPGLVVAGFYVGGTGLAVVMGFLYQPTGGIKSIYVALGTFLVGGVLYWIQQAFAASDRH